MFTFAFMMFRSYFALFTRAKNYPQPTLSQSGVQQKIIIIKRYYFTAKKG